jgi:hypothetical protein
MGRSDVATTDQQASVQTSHIRGGKIGTVSFSCGAIPRSVRGFWCISVAVVTLTNNTRNQHRNTASDWFLPLENCRGRNTERNYVSTTATTRFLSERCSFRSRTQSRAPLTTPGCVRGCQRPKCVRDNHIHHLPRLWLFALFSGRSGGDRTAAKKSAP